MRCAECDQGFPEDEARCCQDCGDWVCPGCFDHEKTKCIQCALEDVDNLLEEDADNDFVEYEWEEVDDEMSGPDEVDSLGYDLLDDD